MAYFVRYPASEFETIGSTSFLGFSCSNLLIVTTEIHFVALKSTIRKRRYWIEVRTIFNVKPTTSTTNPDFGIIRLSFSILSGDEPEPQLHGIYSRTANMHLQKSLQLERRWIFVQE